MKGPDHSYPKRQSRVAKKTVLAINNQNPKQYTNDPSKNQSNNKRLEPNE